MLWWSMTWYQRLTCITVSETNPQDHQIILCEFLMGNKANASSSFVWVQIKCSKGWVNCSRASVKLQLSCTIFAIIQFSMILWLLHISSSYALCYTMKPDYPSTNGYYIHAAYTLFLAKTDALLCCSHYIKQALFLAWL